MKKLIIEDIKQWEEDAENNRALDNVIQNETKEEGVF
jgi:hypothetical protein